MIKSLWFEKNLDTDEYARRRGVIFNAIDSRNYSPLPRDGSDVLGTVILEFLIHQDTIPALGGNYSAHESAHIISGFGFSPGGEERAGVVFGGVLNHGWPNLLDNYKEHGDLFVPTVEVPSLERMDKVLFAGPRVGYSPNYPQLFEDALKDEQKDFVSKFGAAMKQLPRTEVAEFHSRLNAAKDDETYEKTIKEYDRFTTSFLRSFMPNLAKTDPRFDPKYPGVNHAMSEIARRGVEIALDLCTYDEMALIREKAIPVVEFIDREAGKPFWQMSHEERIAVPMGIIRKAHDMFRKEYERGMDELSRSYRGF